MIVRFVLGVLSARSLSLSKQPNIPTYVPMLEVLDLSDTKVDDETLNLISKNCSGLMQLQLDHCSGVTKKGVECVVKNCRQLESMNASYLLRICSKSE
ncbi:F-box/LRR-repeat protein [Trifolium repens]|nr:F-box/LRR-repeat protein [Trifolium repens]